MRAAAIFGLGSSLSDLVSFQTDSSIEWMTGLPPSGTAADAILIFGGDGTIHRHLAPLVRLALPVLIVPCGSGNDFARALNLHSVQHSLVAWQFFCSTRANVQTIDLGVIEALGQSTERPHSTYFCCVGGCGLDAAAGRLANKLPAWLKAHGGYILSLAGAVVSFRPLHMKIDVDGRIPSDSATPHTEIPAMLIAFANATSYGGGMRIAPQASLDDGLLDFCLVERVSKLRLTYLFPTVYFGRHLKVPEVKYFQGARVRLETDVPAEIYADGEYVCHTPIEVSVAPRALPVIIG